MRDKGNRAGGTINQLGYNLITSQCKLRNQENVDPQRTLTPENICFAKLHFGLQPLVKCNYRKLSRNLNKSNIDIH